MRLRGGDERRGEEEGEKRGREKIGRGTGREWSGE